MAAHPPLPSEDGRPPDFRVGFSPAHVRVDAASNPKRFTVYRPGFVDVDPANVDAPVWPGPDPSEFLKPNPPRGEKGKLTGEQLLPVYLAARDNADALWTVGDTVQWLVVVPLAEGTAGYAGSVKEAVIQNAMEDSETGD